MKIKSRVAALIITAVIIFIIPCLCICDMEDAFGPLYSLAGLKTSSFNQAGVSSSIFTAAVPNSSQNDINQDEPPFERKGMAQVICLLLCIFALCVVVCLVLRQLCGELKLKRMPILALSVGGNSPPRS